MVVSKNPTNGNQTWEDEEVGKSDRRSPILPSKEARMNIVKYMVPALVFVSLLLSPLRLECQEGKDGIFGAGSDSAGIGVASSSELVPLSEITYEQVMEIPKAFDNKYFSVNWVSDSKVEISVKKDFQIGFHLSSYVFPAGTQVKQNGEPWEVQTLLSDDHYLFKGGESKTLEVKLPGASEPAQIDLYTYRVKDGQWTPDVVKVPPHHGPTFGTDRALHSARIINSTPSQGPTPPADSGDALPRSEAFMRKCNFVAGLLPEASWNIECAKKYGMDWRMFLVVAVNESSGGRENFHPYNCIGMGQKTYGSYHETIEDFYKTISGSLYADCGKDPWKIYKKYNGKDIYADNSMGLMNTI